MRGFLIRRYPVAWYDMATIDAIQSRSRDDATEGSRRQRLIENRMPAQFYAHFAVRFPRGIGTMH
jgi:hypothetical protein